MALGTSQKVPEPVKEPERVAVAPQFWKGNLHTHSLWSDGDDFPEMIADWYKTHGYHFLTLSDHTVLSEGERWIPSETTPVRTKAAVPYGSWSRRKRLISLRTFRSVP